jgi:ATP-binding cassette subfamily B protein
MRRINRILDEVPEIRDSKRSVKAQKILGGISVRGLTIAYPGTTNDALRDISLEVEAGGTVAVVGPVGSGKTTLLKAIPRLLDLTAGKVFMDGQDIREIPLKRLRESIGFVTQEIFIFSDTVRNNVLFGRPDASEEDLIATLSASDILEEIQGLESGLDTLLGERGITLSGGQRQRLTIARAVIADPPILILDDALSMVDTRTEERILNRILQLRRQKTNLIVSHRVSTVSRADHTVVLDRGEIVEYGTHETLLRQGGMYASLYERQILARELE